MLFVDEGEAGDYVLMQSTGLKDKNGKEIFEGDILKIDFKQPRCSPSIGAVVLEEYKDGGGAFDGIHLGWRAAGITLPDARDHCEIIGNVYENPNLLPPL